MKKISVYSRLFAVLTFLFFTAFTALAQNNPCIGQMVSETCTSPAHQGLVITQWQPATFPTVCYGEDVSVTISSIDGLPGLFEMAFLDEDCSITTNISPVFTTWITTNWWQAYQVLPNSQSNVIASGTGYTASFAPNVAGTNCYLTFNLAYTSRCPDDFADHHSFSLTTNFTVFEVASLIPTNATTCGCTLLSSNATAQTFVVPVSTNLLHIVGTPYPYVPPQNLPGCWSLYDLATNEVSLSLTNPTVYTVICSAGTSSITNFIWVTLNGEVEEGCTTTTPDLLGYWSFNGTNAPVLVDWWKGEYVTGDSVGTDIGKFYGDPAFAKGEIGEGFSFDGQESYIDFGTNAGNFGTNDFTVDFWVSTTMSVGQGVLGKRVDCGAANMWDIRMGSGGIDMETCQDDSGTYYAAINSTGINLDDGNFHHIVFMRKSTQQYLYIDNILNASITTSGIANISNSASLYAGASACSGPNGDRTAYLTGILDEIKLSQGQQYQPSWAGNHGQLPLITANVSNPPSPWGNALQIDTNTTANLGYRYIEDDGSANINCINGAVEFWFMPDWNGGVGPGNTGTFLEMGDANSSGGWWGVTVDPTGFTLSFGSESNGVTVTYFTYSVADWSSTNWYRVVLDYSLESTALYVNGVLVASGSGMQDYPTINNRLQYGFSIGGDHTGQNQIRGTLDELSTFNCPLSAAAVAADYAADFTVGNQVPDWWYWEYYGVQNLAETTVDLNGNTLLWDYQNNVAPLVYYFYSINVTNNYVNSNPAGVTLNLAGNPFYIAVLVDDANLNDAIWEDYSSTNIPVNLGSSQGWHTVRIGLRGHDDPPSAAVWWTKQLNLDLTPPTIVVTNSQTVVSTPLLQLGGYCPEPISKLTYSISNAAGVTSGLQGFIVAQAYDTNSGAFTTNYFACVDVMLTNGLNLLTLTTTDLAGNQSATTCGFTVDYSTRTNPPNVQILWPQDGAEVSGVFEVRGTVDDPAAVIAASWADDNGDASLLACTVGRDGNFWIENIPNNGVNTVSMTVTDSAGNTTQRSVTVDQSLITVTIDPLSSYQVGVPTLTVTGTISDPVDYALWVNGTQAQINSDGTWSAQNVSMPAFGQGAVQACAIPLSDNGGNGQPSTNPADLGNPTSPDAQTASTTPDVTAGPYNYSYIQSSGGTYTTTDVETDGNGNPVGTPNTDTRTGATYIAWLNDQGGIGTWFWSDTGETQGNSYDYDANSLTIWPPPGTSGYCTSYWEGDLNDDDSGPVNSPFVSEHCAVTSPFIDNTGVAVEPGITFTYDETQVYNDQGTVHLQTGGKPGSTGKNIFLISASATQLNCVKWIPGLGPMSQSVQASQQASIPNQNIQVMGQNLDANGNLYIILPDNQDLDITPTVPGADYYTFKVTPTKYKSQFRVFVNQPNPGGTLPINWRPGHLSVGHAWWELATEAPASVVSRFVIPGATTWMNTQEAYGPLGALTWNLIEKDKTGPGVFPFGYGPTVTASGTYDINFQGLIDGLNHCQALHVNPGYYSLKHNNCVDATVVTGGISGVSLPDAANPEKFGDELPPSDDDPIGN